MRVRIAIIGSGGTARHHARAFSQLKDAQVTLVASRNRTTGPALAGELGAQFLPDWREAVQHDSIDGVVICTHNDSHGPIALAALEAGKHVLMEYPLARRLEEGRRILDEVRRRPVVFRLTHSEPLSPMHQALRREVESGGGLLLAEFRRLTPGRGARPEILFNLPVSGPPAHFFVYHVYPAVDLFGPARWVHGAAHYENLREDGRYDAFVNAVTVEFRNGGLGQWTWAGGVSIREPEQLTRYVLQRATLRTVEGGWERSDRNGTARIRPRPGTPPTHQERWLEEIRAEDYSAGHADLAVAWEAIRITLNAERSMNEGRRIVLNEE